MQRRVRRGALGFTTCFVACTGAAIAGCGGSDGDSASSAASLEHAASTTGITSDFRAFLAARNVTEDFARDDLAGGSFGGRTTAGEAIHHDPVVFVHGNSDRALDTTGSGYLGWNASVAYFQSQGYSNAELYGTTWGPADSLQAGNQEHSRANVLFVRHFLESVLAYTGASKIDVISHSMGVTLARKAILGGSAKDAGGSYQVGSALTGSVDTFVGIAGANLGLSACFSTATVPTCGDLDGFYPGFLFFGAVTDLSQYLVDLQGRAGGEGAFRFAMFSLADEVIGGGDLVYGQYTSRIPRETGEVVFSTAPYGHFGTKTLTADVQLRLVTQHH